MLVTTLIPNVHLPENPEIKEIDLPVIASYEVFHWLYKQGKEQFQFSMIGESGDDGTKAFWDHALKERWAQEHPMVMRNTHRLDKLLPVTYHMDGAEVHRNQEYFYVIVGNPVVQYGQIHPLDGKFCLVAISHVLMKVPGVMKRAMHLVGAWTDHCHQVMELGVMPHKGFYKESFPRNSLRAKVAGEPIMGDYLPVYAGTKSDGKARVPHHIAS